ncbi:Pre-mRNA-splicing factor SYF2 [Yarrowia sp. C11]|nr:Pre-mRNA-splicing factor SYF2 [Yarrowia sp. C11]KAG5363991.1 Pre-mRNA-splicing factor SYF2 [Yarrowia sp. E02]
MAKKTEKKTAAAKEKKEEAKPSAEEAKAARLARLSAIRAKMNDSSTSNRKALFEEDKDLKVNKRADALLERKQQEAEFELEKLQAEQRGEDFDRKRAWDWTVKETQEWKEKKERKRERESQSGVHDMSSTAQRAYEKDLASFKPDLDTYEKEKETGLHQTPSFGHKPTPEALDRLVNGLTKGDKQRMKRRKQAGADDQHATYISDKNKQFNEKLNRQYDKYTKEIRDNFERGTAL